MAPLAAAIQSVYDLGHCTTQPDVISWESILRKEENRGTRRKTGVPGEKPSESD